MASVSSVSVGVRNFSFRNELNTTNITHSNNRDTADEFFVPVLEHIVEFFNVPQSIAGITFLSFGNGAPDVFSAIVSYAGGGGGDIGLGALLGSGVYVTTVICAVIAFSAPPEKSTLYRRPFLRDIVFYLIILSYMVILFIAEATITMGLALGFVIIYIAYIVFVIAARYIYQSMKMQKRVEEGIARLESQNSMERGLLSSSSSESDPRHHIELPKAKDDWGYSGYNSYVLEVANRHHHHDAKTYVLFSVRAFHSLQDAPRCRSNRSFVL